MLLPDEGSYTTFHMCNNDCTIGPSIDCPPRHEDQLLRSTRVSTERWDQYVLALYGATPADLPRLPRIDQVDLIYTRALPLAGVLRSSWDSCPSTATHRPISLPQPHVRLAAFFTAAERPAAYASHAWVEVTHCASHIEDQSLWFYIVRGSGIFVNVGRTIVFNDHPDAARFFGVYGDITHVPAAAAAAGYDSVQYLEHCEGCRCDNELMMTATTSPGTSACPRGIEFRTGVNASAPCACVARPIGSDDRSSCITCANLAPMIQDGTMSPAPPPPAMATVAWFSTRVPPPLLSEQLRGKTCAMVGGGHGVLERMRGDEIDAHDVVIRVNRLVCRAGAPDCHMPASSQVDTRYLGSQTDLLVLDRCFAGRQEEYLNEEEDDGYRFAFYGDGSDRGLGQCHPSGYHADCPFSALVYKGATPWMDHDYCTGEHAHVSDLRRKVSHSREVAFGIMTDELMDGVAAMRGYRTGDTEYDKPTTGFYAVVALAPLCKELDLYGFSGDTTADGHVISSDHSIAREHALLRDLSEHRPIASMPESLRAVWPSTRLRVVC